MRILSYFVVLIIVLMGLTFASLNSTPVIFNYYLGSKSMALSLLLVLTLGVGIFFGLLMSLFSWIKMKSIDFKLRSQLKNAEKEIQNLRSIPIKE